MEKLTFQQQAFARQYNPDALEQLDLAALLRVVDQNWYELTQKLNLNKEARNWLKEAKPSATAGHMHPLKACRMKFTTATWTPSKDYYKLSVPTLRR